MTQFWRISADDVGFRREIREYPPNPRHPRSIPAISVLIRSIRVIRVLFLFTNNFYMHPECPHHLTIQKFRDKLEHGVRWRYYTPGQFEILHSLFSVHFILDD